jgi:hypothetical protein
VAFDACEAGPWKTLRRASLSDGMLARAVEVRANCIRSGAVLSESERLPAVEFAHRGERGWHTWRSRMTGTMRLGFMVASLMVWAVGLADAAVLCRKGSGAVFVRDTECKRKEVQLDAASFIGELPTRVTTLESNVTTLESDLTTLESTVTTMQATVTSLGDIREVLSLTGLPVLGPFTLDATLASLSFTNTEAGRARISVSMSALATCAGGVPFGAFYLRVDGVDVPDSAAAIPDSGSLFPVRLIGTTETALDPGTHTVEIALDCLTGGSGFGYGPHIDGDVMIIRVKS